MSDVPNHDPQTGKGAVWGDEFVDTAANDPVENEPGSQAPPDVDPDQSAVPSEDPDT